MTNDPRLERYLGSLENALRPFPVSDRAEIITEIKSHVLSALDRDPQTRLDTVLSALGEPETVANRYLLERGLKPTKTSIHPIVKWLVIGFLTTLAMLLIFAGFVLAHFNSLLTVDGVNDRVQMFGGLIDIDGKKNQISISGISDSSAFAGAVSLKAGQLVVVPFNAGRFEIGTSDTDEFKWACKGQGSGAIPKNTGDTTTFDLSKSGDVKCSISLPEKYRLEMAGKTGKIFFDAPRFALKADLEKGKIEFKDAANMYYKFAISVGTGKADTFVSSESLKAASIELHVGAGKIDHNEESK